MVLCVLLFRQCFYHYVVSHNIAVVFKEHMLMHDIDKQSVNFNDGQPDAIIKGFDQLLKKIDYFVQKNQPLILTMVGFPYKSSNTRDKVLISEIDAAEYYSLCYLQIFLDRIKECYSPGAQLYIFTDGMAFCDIENVSDASVIVYEDSLKIASQDLSDITIITMRDLCPDETSQEIRDIICKQEPSERDFDGMVQSDEKLRSDVAVLAERMKFELALLFLTDEEVAKIGFQETHRSLQFSNFLRQFRPVDAIACSVHYQNDVSKKIGLQLSRSCVTPWHGILVKNDIEQEPMIMHIKDIDVSLYRTAYKKVHGLQLVYLAKNY